MVCTIIAAGDERYRVWLPSYWDRRQQYAKLFQDFMVPYEVLHVKHGAKVSAVVLVIVKSARHHEYLSLHSKSSKV